MKTQEIAAQAMQTDLQRLTNISQNLANSQTPGYKRMVSVQRPFTLAMDAAGLDAAQPGLQSAVDSTGGALRATGNALDVAVDGEGFFAVQTAQGLALTRRAALRLDAQGRLVNDDGQPLIGERGEIRVGATVSSLRVDEHGELWADGRSSGKLQVLRVADSTALQAIGGGLYRAGDNDAGQPLEAPRVKAGYQEASNVNSSAEMVRLMETSRHFEAMARVVQGYDETLEKAIRKLGDL